MLARNGHSNIALVECDAVFKLDAAKFALTQEQFTEEQRAVIAAYINSNGKGE